MHNLVLNLLGGIALMTSPGQGQPASAGAGLQQLVPTRSISTKDVKRVHVLRSQNVSGWDLELRIGNPQALDLGLEVFTEDPESGPGVQSKCISNPTGAVKRCRVVNFNSPQLWVRVTAFEGNGSTLYEIWGRRLAAPVVGETNLTGSDALPLLIGQPVSRRFEYSDPPIPDTFDHLFELRVPTEARGQDLLVSCNSQGSSAALGLNFFDASGQLLGSSEPSTSHQYRLGAPSSPRIFVQVSLSLRRAIFSKASYDLVVAVSSAEIPLRLKGESLTVEDDSPRTFSVNLDRSPLAAIVLESSNFEMDVNWSNGGQFPAETMPGGQIVHVGSQFQNSPFVYQSLTEPLGRLRISIRHRSSARPSFTRGWRLQILNPISSDRYMIHFDFDQAQIWQEWTQAQQGRLARGALKAYALGVFGRDSKVGQQTAYTPRAMSARLTGPDAERLSMAVCNRYGQVLAIGASILDWELPQEVTDAYLVVFPSPWDPAQTGGAYELRLTLGRPNASRK